MKISRGRALVLCFAIISILLVAFGALALKRTEAAPAAVTYEDLPAAQFPAKQDDLLGAVYGNDLNAQRAHAWRLWAALNTGSHARAYGEILPIWQTWYSSTEVYGGTFGAVQHRFTCCEVQL